MVSELIDEVILDVTWCVERMALEIIDELICFVQSTVINLDEISVERGIQPLYFRLYNFKTDLPDCCYDLLNFNLPGKLSSIDNQLILTKFNDKNFFAPDMNGLVADIGNFLATANVCLLTRPFYLNSVTRTVLQVVHLAPNITVFKFKVFGELRCKLKGFHTGMPAGLHSHLGYSLFGPEVPRLQDIAMISLLSHRESYIRGKSDILSPELMSQIECFRCSLSCSDMNRANLNHSLTTPTPSIHQCNYHFGCHNNHFIGSPVKYRGHTVIILLSLLKHNIFRIPGLRASWTDSSSSGFVVSRSLPASPWWTCFMSWPCSGVMIKLTWSSPWLTRTSLACLIQCSRLLL